MIFRLTLLTELSSSLPHRLIYLQVALRRGAVLSCVEFILAQSVLFICNLIMLYFLSICAYNWYVLDVRYIVDLVCVSIDVEVNSFRVDNRDSFTGL